MTTQPPPDPGVYISLPQMYQEVQHVSRLVSRMDGKLDGILAESREIKGDVSDHEARIRALELGETPRQQRNDARLSSLESGRWPLPALGALTGLAGVATGVAALFMR
ncbi:hypothetical protein AQJ11_03295 [Streptomyces corchorusii]|uniref:Uncharacterized protein n=2 Tax=Streptomyces TaxID=1883 RepID=A0A117QK00_STRCK|nr:hypothetical protein [Streptomyces corchorusii]KUN32564.1 hypothetical protein AQJ11_03295 [Streptomyces corchorusii]